MRYVDDIFVILMRRTDSALEILDQIRKNIKFTSKFEHDNNTPFLELNSKRIDDRFETLLYRKKNQYQFISEI